MTKKEYLNYVNRLTKTIIEYNKPNKSIRIDFGTYYSNNELHLSVHLYEWKDGEIIDNKSIGFITNMTINDIIKQIEEF